MSVVYVTPLLWKWSDLPFSLDERVNGAYYGQQKLLQEYTPKSINQHSSTHPVHKHTVYGHTVLCRYLSDKSLQNQHRLNL